MDVFEEVNELSGGGHSEFRVLREGDGRLVLMGGFDLDYYHDVEVSFEGVTSSTCPAELRWPRFHDAGEGRYRIVDDEGSYEVVARGVRVEIAKVYHYDRGARLRPGERIAPWVRDRQPVPGERPHPLWIALVVLAIAAGAYLGFRMGSG